MDGRVDLLPLQPFPLLSDGRIKQVDELLARVRHDKETVSGVQRLRRWELTSRPTAWPAPLLARVLRQVGASDASAALSGIAHLALGVRLIRAWGNEAQLEKVQGTPDALCAFALTEEAPGSDVSRIQTYAEPVPNGFVLNGTKHWVTNAMSATHFVVIARTATPRAADKPRLTAFLVPFQDGVEVTPVETDVLLGSGVARVTFRDIKLKKSDVLGTEAKGFRVVMGGLAEARLYIGAAVLGACIRAFNDTLQRVDSRRAFGRSMGKFPSVQYRIAGMESEILAMESLVHAVAGLAEPGAAVDPVERAIVRLGVSRGAARVLDAARELHGAAAFAGNMKAARHWADTRALTLLDGSDLALESYIVLEGTRSIRQRLGRLRAAPDMLSRVDAAASILVDKAKSRLHRGAELTVPGMKLDRLYQFATQLGLAVDQAVRKHGVELVEKQHIQSRLAGITVDLSIWSAMAARLQTELERSGEIGTRRMIDVASIWVNAACHRVRELFDQLDENDDRERDRVAARALADRSYPFDVF